MNRGHLSLALWISFTLAAACGRGGDDPFHAIDDPNPRRRVAAATALGDQSDPRAIVPLRRRLSDPNPQVRGTVVLALGKLGGSRALPDLAPLIKDRDMSVRFAVIAALGGIDDENANSPLFEALDDRERRVRAAARTVLERRGFTGSEQVERAASRRRDQLIQQAASSSWTRRLETARGLAECGDAESLVVLADLVNDHEPQIAAVAAKGLGAAGPSGDPEWIVELLGSGATYLREAVLDGLASARPASSKIHGAAVCDLLLDPEVGRRAAKVVVVQELRCPSEPLVEALATDELEGRLRAAEVIGALGEHLGDEDLSRRGADLLWREANVDRLIAVVGIRSQPEEIALDRVRRELVNYLSSSEHWIPAPVQDRESSQDMDPVPPRLMGISGEEAITELLSNYPPRVSEWVELFPPEVNPPEVATLLLIGREVEIDLDEDLLEAIATRSPDQPVRAAAVWAMGGGDPFLQDPAPLVRAAAAEALGSEARELSGRLKARLAYMLTDTAPGVRRAAASTLAATGDPVALRPLIAAFRRWPGPETARALATLGGGEVGPILAGYLHDARGPVTEELIVAILEGLAVVGDEAQGEVVSWFLDHPDAEVRAAAVRAAQAIGTAELVALSSERRHDFARVVRDAATLLPSR